MRRRRMIRRLIWASILITGVAFAAEGPPQNQKGGISQAPGPKEIAGQRLAREVPHVGAFVGFSGVPREETGPLFGIEVGTQPWRRVSVGANLGFAGLTQDNSRMMLFGQAAYHFVDSTTPIIKNSFATLNAGWFRDSIDVAPGLTQTDYYPGFGPTLGFDLPVEKVWGIGAEAKYIVNFREGTDNNFSMVASVKRWL